MKITDLQGKIDASAEKAAREEYERVWKMFPREKRPGCGGMHTVSGMNMPDFVKLCKNFPIKGDSKKTLEQMGITCTQDLLNLIEGLALVMALGVQVQEKARLESELLEFAETLYDGVPEGWQRED